MFRDLNEETGFIIDKFNDINEFNKIKNFIEKSFNQTLRLNNLSSDNQLYKLEDYHKLSLSEEEHKRIWTRENRRANDQFVDYILKTSFFKNLQKIFGNLEITNMVENNKSDVFWRLVRPNKPNDVGPIHADSWFWKANNVEVPNKKKCLKIWMMISNNSGPGLGVIPSSHNKKDWIYNIEFKDGLNKPVFDYENNKFSLKETNINPEEFILFNYDLLHCGLVNKSNNTRCSLEMTFFYPNS